MEAHLERRMTKISVYLLFTSLLSLGTTIVIHGQSQIGFISIDCGLGNSPDYIDVTTGIPYTSDALVTDTGVENSISPDLKSIVVDRQLHYLRSFPQETRNCYTLTPAEGKDQKYLIRARFMYGNYDSKDQLPEFDLHLGVEHWDTVTFTSMLIPVSKEIIHVALSDYIHVCLVNTGRGTPFISALELRPLNNTLYAPSGTLNLISRFDFGLPDNQLIRYEEDVYDRLWEPFGSKSCPNCKTLSTDHGVYPKSLGYFDTPSTVMRTAYVPDNSSEPLKISWEPDNSTDVYFLCLHFAEIELLRSDSRKFEIFINGGIWGPGMEPLFLKTTTAYGTQTVTHPKFEIFMNMTGDSTLPPLINAMEIFSMKDFNHSQTNDNDGTFCNCFCNFTEAMYGVTRNWNGDPCAPQSYAWSGLGCIYHGLDPARIISLNMSASGLKGLISPYIANLTNLSSLDLSQNNLTGEVPVILSRLAFLRVLNLKGNNFTGSLPPELVERSSKGLLLLSFDGGELVKKKTKSHIVSIIAAVAAVLVLLIVALAMFWFAKRRKQKGTGMGSERTKIGEPFKIKNREFTFLEVQNMTNNFQRVVGKGGFGTVYYGLLGETEIAVKMLSPSSSQGYKEFHSEANLLIYVHHKKLTSLVGYCNEGTHMGLIYEYLANGSLENHLSGKNPDLLSWKQRLQVAIDAAQGLDYMHHGCKPAIIHRDVKTTNILLDENFHAKLSDFGLSRVFSVEGDTHVTTVVAGTPGYLDPEYHTTNRLTVKSDVYSFGVVLLEMVAGRPAISRYQDEINHIVNWVTSILADGDVRKIADPRFHRDFDVNSVWNAIELAMSCVSPKSAERPTMEHMVIELKQCLATEMAQKETRHDYSTREITTSLDTGLGILPR